MRAPDGGSVLAEAQPAAFTPVANPFEKAWSVAQTFRLTPDEGLYGLGQHQDSAMNYRERSVTLVQTNTDAVTPAVVSTRGWGLLWDNDSKTRFADGAPGAALWSEVADNVDYATIEMRWDDYASSSCARVSLSWTATP